MNASKDMGQASLFDDVPKGWRTPGRSAPVVVGEEVRVQMFGGYQKITITGKVIAFGSDHYVGMKMTIEVISCQPTYWAYDQGDVFVITGSKIGELEVWR